MLTILFGLGVMQVLLMQPKGVVEDLTQLGTVRRPPRCGPLHRSHRRSTDGSARMIEVDGLTVRFGGVTPIDDMTVTWASA